MNILFAYLFPRTILIVWCLTLVKRSNNIFPSTEMDNKRNNIISNEHLPFTMESHFPGDPKPETIL